MFYKKGININHTKEAFNFIKDHFTYFTMSSWNRLRSIANNVKLYNLDLGCDYTDAYNAMEELDFNSTINEMISEWEANHSEYGVGFNGRSDGYLVLYNIENNRNVIPDYITDYDTWEEFKEDHRVVDYKGEITYYTNLVREFDKLCDDMVAALKDTINTYKQINKRG